MITNLKINLETIEAMLYFWQAVAEKDNVPESFFYDLADMKGLKLCYDDEFTSESVRLVLSAIKNRELLSNATLKEKRFWNYNMWVMEDFEYTMSMVTPIKTLNLNYLVKELNEIVPNSRYEEIEVIFAPLHVNDYMIKDNCLIINFFRVKPSDFDHNTFIGDNILEEYIKEKLIELLNN
ncbi:hypothetical protein [Clostridium hydrogeniformans]|uniref:TDE2712 family protein n=1 Tax=Clostridium hydrogeniformans TaxID=349933 RepID=UPI000488E1FF|nr:hypothetical protein [Clostridium hydrogeniformans]